MERKRFFASTLTLCLLLSFLSLSVCATEVSLEQQLIDSCTYGQTVDLSSYCVTDMELETQFQKELKALKGLLGND